MSLGGRTDNKEAREMRIDLKVESLHLENLIEKGVYLMYNGIINELS